MTTAALVSDDALSALRDERGQVAALTSLSLQALQADDPFRAFAFADRRCRLGSARAYDFMLRSEALQRLGFEASARADLERALDLDPTDPVVNARLIMSGHPAAATAARWVVADPRSGAALLDQAVRFLFAAGVRLVGRLTVEGGRLAGWVRRQTDHGVALDLVTSSGRVRIPCPAGAAAPDRPIAIDHRFEGDFVSLRGLQNGEPAEDVVLSIRINPTPRAARETAPATPPPDADRLVTVIVPIYDDFEVTRACLESLGRQHAGEVAIRVVLIDDAAPSADLSAMVADLADRYGFDLIVNPQNLGFIGAVNTVLHGIDAGDVLLLNADVVLPGSAIQKLARAAHARPDIGIVNPLTNNGQSNSFPVAFSANAFESAARIEAIDALAGERLAGQTVPIPGGIGYCMYITRACLDAVGGIPEVYLRGYYEDTEFSLRARQRGFGSVCALDVYVGHKGTVSFKGEKQLLVARNERVLDARFPAHHPAFVAFRRADPLRQARGLLEAAAFPMARADVIVAGSAVDADVLTARAAALDDRDEVVVTVSWSASNGETVAELRVGGAAEPRQQAFVLRAGEPQADLVAALRLLRAGRIELAGQAGAFGATLDALLDQGMDLGVLITESLGCSPPVEHDCLTPDQAAPCAVCLKSFDEAWRPQGVGFSLADALQEPRARVPSLIVPMDAMAQELATDLANDVFHASRFERFIGEAPVPFDRCGSTRRVVALLYPKADPATERLLIALAAAAVRAGLDWTFVVLGGSPNAGRLMSTGNVFVTGPVEPGDYPAVADHYGAAALIALQRWSGYGPLVRVAGALDRPKAYFDWSIGALAPQGADLAIDPRVCDVKAAGAICTWLQDQGAGKAA